MTRTLHFAIEENQAEFGVPQSDTNNLDLRLNLLNEDWYVFNDCYGTSTEKSFVRYIHEIIDELKQKYDHVYLFRNERHLQIFNFPDGRAFEPDFVLFLIQSATENGLQVFIEPKGSHLVDKDEWKENLLLNIEDQHVIQLIQGQHNYIVTGMPFYTIENRNDFGERFREKILK